MIEGPRGDSPTLSGPLDLIFIDAESAATRLPGGRSALAAGPLIVADDTIRDGAGGATPSATTRARSAWR